MFTYFYNYVSAPLIAGMPFNLYLYAQVLLLWFVFGCLYFTNLRGKISAQVIKGVLISCVAYAVICNGVIQVWSEIRHGKAQFQERMQYYEKTVKFTQFILSKIPEGSSCLVPELEEGQYHFNRSKIRYLLYPKILVTRKKTSCLIICEGKSPLSYVPKGWMIEQYDDRSLIAYKK